MTQVPRTHGPALASRADATGEHRFRHDINALRAMAASVVVLFHFHVTGFDGGFVGVDVFFVISGLLMTQIIEKGIARGNFSILGFYAARVRRIVPALAVLSLALVLMGLFFIDPLTLAETARNATASVLFVSNILYAFQSGYFADASEANWLLHTWTLSAEWQFYMIYPIVLALASRWTWLWRHRLAFLAIGCALGFAGMVWISSQSTQLRDYAFFLLPTRAWEMLAGGVLALWAPRPSRAISALLAIVGFAAILLSVFWLDSAVPWPSTWSLLPVIGTVTVLAADQEQARWAQLPGVPLLGAWSYSLYLWHWPIFVALTYYGLKMTAAVVSLGIIVSVVAAAFSYTLVETKLRNALFGHKKALLPQRRTLIAAGAVAVLAGFVSVQQTTGFEALRTQKLPARARAQLADFRATSSDWVGLSLCEQRWRIGMAQGCVLGKGNPQRVAVIGDSHAEQMIPRLKRIAAEGNVEITVLRSFGCAPLSGLLWTRGEDECATFADRVFPSVAKGKYDRVIVHAAWALYFGDSDSHWTPGALCSRGWRGCRPENDAAINRKRVDAAFGQFAQRLRTIRASGSEVAILLPEPFNFGILPRNYYRHVFFSGAIDRPSIDRAVFEKRTSWVHAKLEAAAAIAGALTLDPLTYQCSYERCPLTVNNRFIYKDKHHIRASIVGSARAFGYLDSFVRHGAGQYVSGAAR